MTMAYSTTQSTGPVPPEELERRRLNRSLKMREFYAERRAEREAAIAALDDALAALKTSLAVAESQLRQFTAVRDRPEKTQIYLAALDKAQEFLGRTTNAFGL